MVAVLGISTAAEAITATFQALGTLDPNYPYSYPYDVSADGNVVVGRSRNIWGSYYAFRWEDGNMVGLGNLPGGGAASCAYGVSADGAVVVGVGRSANGNEAFRWEDGNMVGLGSLDSNTDSEAQAVSADGSVVVGFSRLDANYQAFRWTQESNMVRIGDKTTSRGYGVSDDGQVVVGLMSGFSPYHAFRWTVDGNVMSDLGDLPGGPNWSEAFGVSGDGEVVVGMSGSSPRGWDEPFRWTLESNVMTGLGRIGVGNDFSSAYDVSADGELVVGVCEQDTFEVMASVWTEANGMRELKQILLDDGVDLSGWYTLEEATGVSDDGTTIVGWGKNADGNFEGWIATINLPPKVQDKDTRTEEGTSLQGQVQGSDVNGDSLTFSVASGPSNGDANMASDGNFIYTPDANFVGSDSFTFKANDGSLDSQAGTVNINVYEVTAKFTPLGALGDPNDFHSEAYDVSNDGFVVVGKSRVGGGWRAFRWDDGNMEALDDLPMNGYNCRAYGVSAAGNVIVGVGNDWDGDHAVRWVNGTISRVPQLSGEEVAESWAHGVSADGTVVVGTSKNLSDANEAFRWTVGDGNSQRLGDLPQGEWNSRAFGVAADGNLVVGIGSDWDYDHAAKFVSGSVTMLPQLTGSDMSQSWGYGVSPDGAVIVGNGENMSSNIEAFRYVESDGNTYPLGDLSGGSFASCAYDASNSGQTIVGYGTTASGQRAMIWDASNGMRNLKTVLQDDYSLDMNGWTLTEAKGVSADGRFICGYGTDPNSKTQGWVAWMPPLE